jgi:hypothetical protein
MSPDSSRDSDNEPAEPRVAPASDNATHAAGAVPAVDSSGGKRRSLPSTLWLVLRIFWYGLLGAGLFEKIGAHIADTPGRIVGLVVGAVIGGLLAAAGDGPDRPDPASDQNDSPTAVS